MRDLRQIVCTQHSYEMGIKCHVHSQPHFSRRQLGSRKQCLITCKGLDSNSNSLLTKVTTILPSAGIAPYHCCLVIVCFKCAILGIYLFVNFWSLPTKLNIEKWKNTSIMTGPGFKLKTYNWPMSLLQLPPDRLGSDPIKITFCIIWRYASFESSDYLVNRNSWNKTFFGSVQGTTISLFLNHIRYKIFMFQFVETSKRDKINFKIISF